MANKDKKVTNGELARMIAVGFANTATKEALTKSNAFLANISEDTSETKVSIGVIREVQDMHTTALDEIRKNTEISSAETAALKASIKRHQEWIAQIADKLGLQLEGLQDKK